MKIFVIGAAIIDIILQVDRLPQTGDDVIAKGTKITIGGCAYNVASTLRNMGCEHMLCVPVGKGFYSKLVETTLEKLKYPVLIRDDSTDNGFCISFVEANGERTFVDGIGNEAGFQKELLNSINIDDYSDLYIAGYQIYGKDGECLVNWLATLQNKRIFFAPGPVITMLNQDLMKRIMNLHPVLHLNNKEAMEYTKAPSIEDALYELYFQCRNFVFVTCGSKGTMYYDGKSVHTIPAYTVQAIDTSGAGDSHIAALMAGICQGHTIEQSVRMANHVAADIVTVAGPVMEKNVFTEKKLKWED